MRPCTASAWMPACSAMRATVVPLRCVRSQPVRIFRVTGTETASTTASRMRPTSVSSRSSAAPARAPQTFLAGQPMLMSIISSALPDVEAGGLGHGARVGAENLHAAWAGFAGAIQPQPGLAAVPQPPVGANHLRNRQPRAQSPAQLPERPVADTGHRRQHEGWRDQVGADVHGWELCGENDGYDTGMWQWDEAPLLFAWILKGVVSARSGRDTADFALARAGLSI